MLWYALRVRARHEKQVMKCLESKGIETFLPLYLARRRWSDRVQAVELPLFDGYVFCHTDVQQRLPVLVTPGVIHFVGVGKMPVAVDEHEIHAIQTVVKSASPASPWPFLREGDLVRVDGGPLRNLEGILVRTHREDQVVVSVTLLQRSVAVRVEREWITPIRTWLRNCSNPALVRA